jgi:hypothetical protein
MLILDIPQLITIARSDGEVPLLLQPRRRAVGVYLARLWLFLLASIASSGVFVAIALLIRAGGHIPALGPVLAVVAVVAGVLLLLGLILRFLWNVYDHGRPNHVLDVARALRQVYDPSWPRWLRNLLQHSHDDDHHEEEVD